MQAVIHPIHPPSSLLMLEPMCLNLCIFSAILVGDFHLFVSALGVVSDTGHGFSLWQVGLTLSRLWVDIVIAAAQTSSGIAKMFD